MGNYKRNKKFNQSNNSSHLKTSLKLTANQTQPQPQPQPQPQTNNDKKYKVHLTMSEIRMLIECLDESYNVVQDELEYEHRENNKPDKDYVKALFRDEDKIKSLLIKFDSIYYSEKTVAYKDYIDSLSNYSYDLSSKTKA